MAVGGDDGPVYVADARTGLVTYRWRDLEVPTGTYDTLGQSTSAVTIDRLAYVATQGGLWVVDVRDTAAPRPVQPIAEVGPVAWVKHDRGALLTMNRGSSAGPVWLQSLDLADPEAPRLVGRLRLPMLDHPYGDAFDISGGVLWKVRHHADDRSELEAYDVSRLTGPRPLGSVAFDAPVQAFAIDGNRAFVALRSRSPVGTPVGCSIATVDSLRLDGSVVWATSNGQGHWVSAIGVSDPARPTLFGRTRFDATVKLAAPPGPVMLTGDVDAGHGVGLHLLALP